MKRRIITAIIGIIICLAVLFFANYNSIVLNIAISLVTGLMCYEFLSYKDYNKDLKFVIPSILVGILSPLTIYTEFAFVPLYLFLLIFFLFTIIFYNKERIIDAVFIFAGTVLISLIMSAFCYTSCKDNKYTIFWALMFLAVPWLADSGAYFVGRAFGKHKLCKEVSPHKTIEGAIGGIITGLIAAFIVVLVSTLIYQDITINYFAIILIGLLCPAISIIGDLSFSEIKRYTGIKDFGNILPGHGGMLDRFDSVLFTIPFIYLLSNFVSVVG